MADKSFRVKHGLIVNTDLIFANNGQVGINNTTPDSSLTVTGTANVSGNVTVSTGQFTVGNSTVNAVITSTQLSTTNITATNISGTLQTVAQPNITANNSDNLNGQAASYYTNADNLDAGTIPFRS